MSGWAPEQLVDSKAPWCMELLAVFSTLELRLVAKILDPICGVISLGEGITADV